MRNLITSVLAVAYPSADLGRQLYYGVAGHVLACQSAPERDRTVAILVYGLHKSSVIEQVRLRRAQG